MPRFASRLSFALVLSLAGCGESTETDAGSDAAAPVCGDGVIGGGEECDGTVLGPATCQSLGFDRGSLVCGADCTLDDSGCANDGACGDGVVDATANEICDGDELDGNTCMTEGFDEGTLTCTSACELDTSGCTDVPACGDGEINGDEDCDGTLVGTATCQSRGFAGGMLGCTTCAFDTSMCTNCGNGTIDTGESCDGTNVNGQDCADHGFDTGTLACDQCAFDTAGCFDITCGNGTLEAASEDCDASASPPDDLGGATCASLGFTEGVLACSASCQHVTDACTTCGDGVAEGNEACDMTDRRSSTCASEGFLSGTLGCAADCTLDTSLCSVLPAPAMGELVITEIMQNPSGVDTTTGEWFELFNPSATDSYELRGCLVESGGATESFAISTSLTIAPGGFLTFANVASPGFTPSYALPSGFGLTNTTDTVRLVCEAGVVDTVTYDNTYPVPNGESMNLSVGFDAVENDVPGNWCLATTTGMLTTGDGGTPGTTNDVCPIDYVIDHCALDRPLTIDALEGDRVTVYGRVLITGLTDRTTGIDASPNVIGAVGYGPDGSDPTTWTSWRTGVPNPAGSPPANRDEYMADLVVPMSSGSPYDFRFRFSGDGGATWTICEFEGALNSMAAPVANVWINEIHYDNDLTDANEGVEIAGAAGTNLSGYSLELYNGQGTPPGLSYDTVSLSGTIPNESNGFGTLFFARAGIQNGAPDGIALVSPGNAVVQFLCYEGTLTAADGPAVGELCVDIGVAESATGSATESLQLTGTGNTYIQFTWTGPVSSSAGVLNAGQTIP